VPEVPVRRGGNIDDSGKNGGDKGHRATHFGVAKFQSAPGTDN